MSRETTNLAYLQALQKTGATGLEPATSGVTGRRSNQLNYAPSGVGECSYEMSVNPSWRKSVIESE